jgi:Carboxypeptidase regulatory-like domain
MKRTQHTALLLAFALALTSTPPCTTAAQTSATQANAGARRAGFISGIVITDAGQPLADVTVYIREAGRTFSPSRSALTDDAGRFRINDVPRGVYSLSPLAPGYVPVEPEPGGHLCRPGDTVRVTLTKGVVVTGKVTNAAGEPLVGVKIYTLYVRDKEDHTWPGGRALPSNEAETDDRGVYRIFNLMPGSYVILASGRSLYYNGATPYDEDIPTYYPSATRDTAQPVTVRSGEEVGDIDIRYRGERGHAISGVVSGNTGDDPTRSPFNIEVLDARTGMTQAYAFGNPRERHTFAFYGLADGDYIVVAQFSDSDRKTGGIGRARVKVKGADVTGLNVSLAPFASIAGIVLIEPLGQSENKKCEIKRRSLEEVLLNARRDDKTGDAATADRWRNAFRRSAPQENGEFTLTSLEAGAYRLEVSLPSEDYFVRSITLPAAAKAQPPVDAARNPLAVKAGERLSSLTVTVAEGAAALRGHVVPATEGARLPERLRVYLVPAEKEAAADVLRFAEARAGSDGAFMISNVAPGHYFILALPLADDEADNEPARPTAWEATGRAALLKQAAAANFALDLQPCQRLTEYVLRYTPPATKPAHLKSR